MMKSDKQFHRLIMAVKSVSEGVSTLSKEIINGKIFIRTTKSHDIMQPLFAQCSLAESAASIFDDG